MIMELQYARPADDVCDIVAVYYLGYIPPGDRKVVEGAAVAQMRLLLEGECDAAAATGDTYHITDSVIWGPTRGQTEYRTQTGIRFVGAGLLPCGWQALIGAPASDYVDRVCSFPASYEKKLAELVEQLRRASRFEDMVPLLDETTRMLSRFVDPQIRAFVAKVDQWLMSHTNPAVTTLYESIDLSPRQIERLVKHLYGSTPKYLARKYRALKAATMLASDLADNGNVAASTFYDQSHLIREVKKFTGQTPGEIMLHGNELADILKQRADVVGVTHPLSAIEHIVIS